MTHLWFEIRMATRHLKAGGGQTILTVSTVAAGVIVVIFISSLIFGVQQQISELLTDMLPQVTVTPVELEPKPLHTYPDVERVVAQIDRQNPQQKSIDNWQSLADSIRKLPHVSMVAPAIADQGFVSRGGRQLGAMVYGSDPLSLDGVTRVRKYIIQGHYLGMAADEAVVNYKLTKEFNFSLGDRFRLVSSKGESASFKIVGIYDAGSDEDTYRVWINLRPAQSLYRTGTAVQTLLVKGDQLFNADMIADEIGAITPYTVKSWSRQYPQFVATLSVQTAAAFLISGFSLVTAGFAIASVLIVAVLQKGKQIGILKSMGATRTQIFRLFLIEGFGIAIVGSGLGAVAGSGLVMFLDVFKRPVSRPDAIPQPLFPHLLTGTLIGLAVFAAIVSTVVAAALPARRAAGLDPVQVMR